MVNPLRDPRGCRNAEGCSEDPVHTARLGTAYCAGLAGGHPTCLRAAAVLKHFLAYNNEDDRCVTSSGLRPRVLREYDLAAFRPVVASGAATGAMAAYHLVNGRPCHVSPLIETELRSWSPPTGHDWFAVSDAEAPSNLELPLGGVAKVPHSTHAARHAPSPHPPKAQVHPVRGPSSGTPRARTGHRGHRTGLSQHPLRPRLGRRAPARRGVDVLRRAGDRLVAGRRTARRGRPHGRAAADLVSGRRRVSDFPFED